MERIYFMTLEIIAVVAFGGVVYGFWELMVGIYQNYGFTQMWMLVLAVCVGFLLRGSNFTNKIGRNNDVTSRKF